MFLNLRNQESDNEIRDGCDRKYDVNIITTINQFFKNIDFKVANKNWIEPKPTVEIKHPTNKQLRLIYIFRNKNLLSVNFELVLYFCKEEFCPSPKSAMTTLIKILKLFTVDHILPFLHTSYVFLLWQIISVRKFSIAMAPLLRQPSLIPYKQNIPRTGEPVKLHVSLGPKKTKRIFLMLDPERFPRVGHQFSSVVINHQARSRFFMIADGKYRATSLGRNTWKKLIGSRASLQPNCNKEGFNAIGASTAHSKARIGIFGNNENECNSCDSRIGFGTGGYHDDSNTCGNESIAGGDNRDQHITAMGYILVQ